MSSLNHIYDFLTAFKEGKEDGFDYFFNSCYKPLCLFAGRYVKDSAAAEDIITESFIRLWAKREIFETESGIKGYLYKTVYNACLRWLEQKQRKNIHIRSYAGQIDTTEQGYLHNIIKAETLNHLHKSIAHLPPQCRKIFTKLYIEGRSVSEIADEMNLSISTIKNQRSRGLKLLKPKLVYWKN